MGLLWVSSDIDNLEKSTCDTLLKRKNAKTTVNEHRCRLGDNGDSVDGDSISIRDDNVIIDHCSASWSVDEVLSTYMDPSETTITWRGRTPAGTLRLLKTAPMPNSILPATT